MFKLNFLMPKSAFYAKFFIFSKYVICDALRHLVTFVQI